MLLYCVTWYNVVYWTVINNIWCGEGHNVDRFFENHVHDHRLVLFTILFSQLAKKVLKINNTRIKTSSFRIKAQILYFPTTRLLWINTYFPNNPITSILFDKELTEVL